MNTLANNVSIEEVKAVNIRLTDTMLYISLSDGREIGAPLARYKWLAQATPEQRAQWSLEPGGYAIYWEALDDGIEICHLLSPYVLA